jgi:RHS repeat-associated protein
MFAGATYTYDAGNYIYKKGNSQGQQNVTLTFFNTEEGYVEPQYNPAKPGKISSFSYTYQYKDHLGNIRLSYEDLNNDGTIDPLTEIKEENHYYPFGLKHKGYNNQIIGRDHNYGYNGIEESNELGNNMLEMDLRQYDPAIARWVVIDPVTHHEYSPYQAFDNNPVFWADPSGADSYNLAMNIFNSSESGAVWRNEGNGTFSTGDSDNNSEEGDDDPIEGSTRNVTVRLGAFSRGSYKQYYHAGGVNGSEAGWYSESQYLDILKPVAENLSRSLAHWNRGNNKSVFRKANRGHGNYSDYINFILSRDTVDNYSDFLLAYGENLRQIHNSNHYTAGSGAIEAMHFSSPFFMGADLLRSLSITTTDGFLFGSITFRTPVNIPVQRFGLMKSNGAVDF